MTYARKNTRYEQQTARRVLSRQASQLPQAISPLPWDVEGILSSFPGKVVLLDRSLGIFVPTTTDVNVAADNSACIERTQQFMVELFDGVSCLQLYGLYKSDILGTIAETVVWVRSFMTATAMRDRLPLVLDFAGQLQRELRQEAIALEIDGKIALLDMQ